MTELRCALTLATARGRIRSARQLAAAAGVSRHRVPAALRAIDAWGLGLRLASPCSNSEPPPCSTSDQPPCSNSEPPLSRTARGRARAQSSEREERRGESISSPLSAEEAASIRLVQAHLASWMAKHGQGVELAPAYPPELFAHDLLTITGTLERLLDILEQLRDEGRKPGYSWGWFVTTVRSRILGHRRTRPAAPLSDDRQPGLWSTPPEIDFASQSAPNAPSGADPRGPAGRDPRQARPPGEPPTNGQGREPVNPDPGFTAELVDQLAQKRRMPQ